MRKVIFEDDEMRVIAMFDTSSRRAALQAVEAVIPLTREDEELSAVVISAAEKLKQISDAEFSDLDFEIYQLEMEEEGEEWD